MYSSFVMIANRATLHFFSDDGGFVARDEILQDIQMMLGIAG